MSQSRSAGGIAEGTIRPARFVKIGSAEGGVLEAGAGELPIGISFRETRRSDYVDTSGDLAHSGEPLSYYTQGARCWVEAGGTITAGNRLKVTTAGKAIATTADGDLYGAVALANGVSGELIPVEVQIGQVAL